MSLGTFQEKDQGQQHCIPQRASADEAMAGFGSEDAKDHLVALWSNKVFIEQKN